MKGDLVHGTVQRFEGGAATVSLGKSEAILPRSEQIPGETHHVGERVKAVILEVRRVGHRVKIILSRTHPDFVRRGGASALLEHVVRVARLRGMVRLSIETGSGPAFEPALTLYRRRGFVDGEAFAQYERSSFNQFLHLSL